MAELANEKSFVDALNSAHGVKRSQSNDWTWSKLDVGWGLDMGADAPRCYIVKTQTGLWNVNPSYPSGLSRLHQVPVEKAVEYFLSIGKQP